MSFTKKEEMLIMKFLHRMADKLVGTNEIPIEEYKELAESIRQRGGDFKKQDREEISLFKK